MWLLGTQNSIQPSSASAKKSLWGMLENGLIKQKLKELQ